MGRIRCVTIGRYYCSGGSDIGKMTAQRLGIPCYDREIIEMAAQRSSIQMSEIKKYEEALLSPMKTPINIFGRDKDVSITEKIFAAQTEVILELVDKGDCIIVGRCADYILKNKVRTLNVFIYSSKEKRFQTAMEKHNIPYEDADNRLKKYDKKRGDYYSLNTGKKWGDKENYDICLDSGKLGYEMCSQIICSAVKLSETK